MAEAQRQEALATENPEERELLLSIWRELYGIQTAESFTVRIDKNFRGTTAESRLRQGY